MTTPAEILSPIQQRLKKAFDEAPRDMIVARPPDSCANVNWEMVSGKLWNSSRVPRRHSECESLSCDGSWGNALHLIAKKLGTGFTYVLCGTRGSGKTQLGVELIRIVTNPDCARKALFCTAMEFFMDLKRAYRRGSEESEMKVVQRYQEPDFLVMDELARRGETDWEANVLFEVLNNRYNEMRDTLLICNMDRAAIEQSLGPSLISRLNETGGIIECNWPSFRK